MLNEKQKKIVFCLMGPTAVGKTELSMQIAEEFSVPIISVDSAMVYRGMDIGTAKPSLEEQARVKHELIDLIEADQVYSVGDFVRDATAILRSQNESISFMVGGTMMYYRALQCGVAELPSMDFACREKILNEANELGWPALHEKLKKIDSAWAGKIKPNDKQRIQRGLEVYYSSGVALSEWQKKTEQPNEFHFVNIVLLPSSRSELHKKIELRFDAMLAAGLIDEVKQLHKNKNLSADSTSMRSLGYRQVWKYLAGDYTLEVMRERAIVATRQFAKRQITWLRRLEDSPHFDVSSSSCLSDLISCIRNPPKETSAW